jgi:TatA/E family protein of Tat protein translocase
MPLLVFEFLGTTELLVIAVVALIIFGPRRLPEIGRTIGRGMAEFKRASEDFRRTWEYEVEVERRQPEPAPAEPETVTARGQLPPEGAEAAGPADWPADAEPPAAEPEAQTIARAPQTAPTTES